MSGICLHSRQEAGGYSTSYSTFYPPRSTIVRMARAAKIPLAYSFPPNHPPQNHLYCRNTHHITPHGNPPSHMPSKNPPSKISPRSHPNISTTPRLNPPHHHQPHLRKPTHPPPPRRPSTSGTPLPRPPHTPVPNPDPRHGRLRKATGAGPGGCWTRLKRLGFPEAGRAGRGSLGGDCEGVWRRWGCGAGRGVSHRWWVVVVVYRSGEPRTVSYGRWTR